MAKKAKPIPVTTLVLGRLDQRVLEIGVKDGRIFMGRGSDETSVYLTPLEARTLCTVLANFAQAIDGESFSLETGR